MAALGPGIYVPIMTFFDADTEDLDLATLRKHTVRLAQAGVAGIVTMGSNGEAVHLSRAERQDVTRTVRGALDDAGFAAVAVTAGCSAQSVRGTLALCADAARAGAGSALVLPPSYYRAAQGAAAVCAFYEAVADAAALPLVLYNYPGVVAGLDMDSDTLVRLARHPNIVGAKFTCGNAGKLARVAAASRAGYAALAGMADFLLQGLLVGGSGAIAGGANVAPKTCVRVYTLFREGRIDEAAKVQVTLSRGDWVLTKSAIPGTKSALQSYYGYGGHPRAPLQRVSRDDALAIKDGIRELMELENSL